MNFTVPLYFYSRSPNISDWRISTKPPERVVTLNAQECADSAGAVEGTEAEQEACSTQGREGPASEGVE